MDCTLTLINNDFEINSNLTNGISDIYSTDEKDIIYQNKQYQIKLKITDCPKIIKNIDLYIGNENINDRFNRLRYKRNGNEFSYSYEYFFSTIFGFADISVEIFYDDDTDECFYSDFFAVAVDKNNEYNLKSIEQMLEHIFQNDIAFSSITDRTSRSLADTTESKKQNFDTEIELLKEIANTYNSNFAYFRRTSNSTLITNHRIDDFIKLKTVKPDALEFIVTNPQYLVPTNTITNIKSNGFQLEPVKTLVTNNINCYDTYENNVIIGFLHFIIDEVTSKIKKANATLIKTQINTRVKGKLLEDYILSSEIVYKYSRATIQKHLKILENIKSTLTEIYAKYKSVFNFKEKIVTQIPKPSNVFLSVHHYRNLYIKIVDWFKHGNYDITKNRIALSFSTADEIYEYYSLLNIMSSLKELGYKEIVDERDAYKYIVSDKRHHNTEMINTFTFARELEKIILYYQPIIYSEENKCRNGISLFRTDTSYFCPDYVIKIISESNVRFVVLDAKWSNRSTIYKERLQNMTYKYCYSICDQNTMKNNSSLWLLQGKDDNIDSHVMNIYFHNNGGISKALNNDDFSHSTGIIKLTPNAGAEGLTSILKKLCK